MGMGWGLVGWVGEGVVVGWGRSCGGVGWVWGWYGVGDSGDQYDLFLTNYYY